MEAWDGGERLFDRCHEAGDTEDADPSDQGNVCGNRWNAFVQKPQNNHWKDGDEIDAIHALEILKNPSGGPQHRRDGDSKYGHHTTEDPAAFHDVFLAGIRTKFRFVETERKQGAGRVQGRVKRGKDGSKNCGCKESYQGFGKDFAD